MIAILDIGKTNKKCLVFDEDYCIVSEKTTQLPETTDEDGDACENLDLLRRWVWNAILDILENEQWIIRAINVTTYGASFVHLGSDGQPLTPLYNYLKPFPNDLKKQFFDTYGGEEKMALETASPALGNLNSGLQLYALKYQKPLIFNQIKYALHLPQFVTSLLHDQYFSEITSIGCHTMLWDFRKNDYHDWVKAEGMAAKFPPIRASNKVVPVSIPVSAGGQYHSFQLGTGLHDSSAALIPYLACFDEPFLLISTGTWCISLNPFNQESLTPEELSQDCLCYLSYEGKPVKAARFFGGYEHEQAVKNLAEQFGESGDFYKTIQISSRSDAAVAYLKFMRQLVEKQAVSTRLALGRSPVRRIFVDGGFAQNNIYMTLLAGAFPEMEVCAAEVAQASALGAALAIHPFWNDKPLPENLVSLKKY